MASELQGKAIAILDAEKVDAVVTEDGFLR